MLTIDRKALATELALLQSVAEKKGTIPILQFALLEFDGARLSITATDLDVTLACNIEATGEPWSGCVPLRELSALARLFTEDVQFAPKPKDRIEVKSGASKHLLPSPPKDSFPQVPSLVEPKAAQLDGSLLREGLMRVLPCVTTEESRYTLAGVQFETKGKTLQLIATDTHRLGVATLPCETELKALIPLASLRTLVRLESDSIETRMDNNHAEFKCGHRLLTTRLLIGTFPNWEMIMPKELPHQIRVDAKALTAAIRRVSLTRAVGYKTGTGTIWAALKFTLAADSLTVESQENDKGKSDEAISVTSNLNGKDYPVGLNSEYVLDFLSQVEGEVTWQMKDVEGHQLLVADGVEFKYVVMPTRL